jgi:MFS family permease
LIRKVFPAIALISFATLLGTGIIVPLIPVYASTLGATGLQIGFVLAGYSITRALILPAIGRLSDQRGRKPFIVIGLVIYTVLSLAYIMADNITTLIVVRLLHGIGAGMTTPIARAYVGDLAPEGEESTWMGYFNTSFLAGLGMGPIMGGYLADHFGIEGAFIGLGVISFIALLGGIIFLPNIKNEKNINRPRPSYRKMLGSEAFRGLFIYRIVESAGRRGWYSFLPVLAGIHLGLPASQIGWIIAANAITSSLLQSFTGRAVDRYKINKRAIIIGSSIFQLVYIIGTPLIGATWGFWGLMALTSIAGIRVAFTSPANSALIIVEGRKYGMGSTMALMATAMSIGMAVGPILAGWSYDLFGSNIDAPYYAAAAVVVMGTVAFSWSSWKLRAASPPGTPGEELSVERKRF